MPIVSRSESGGVGLYIWHITETLEQLELLASSYLCSPRYLAISSVSRRVEWLASKAIYLELALSGEISYNQNGAPVIPNGYISISHSGDLVVLLYSRDRLCGVDVESIDRNFGRVATRFLSVEERDLCHAISISMSVDINTIYARCWGVKEAVYKSLSRTDIEFSRDIIIKSLSDSRSTVLVDKESIFVDISSYRSANIASVIR